MFSQSRKHTFVLFPRILELLADLWYKKFPDIIVVHLDAPNLRQENSNQGPEEGRKYLKVARRYKDAGRKVNKRVQQQLVF
jgi:hypothetical protein